MRRAFKPLLGAIVGTVLVLGLAGCAVNPATGRPTFTAFMSAADEVRIGREEHPKILDEFGGAYHDPAIRRYLSQIGGELGRITCKDRFTQFTTEIPFKGVSVSPIQDFRRAAVCPLMAMSGSPAPCPLPSASPPGADLPGGAAVGPVLTHVGHLTSIDSLRHLAHR